eukprot:TRINITY_DN32019_c0_g2_i1.p1 TRINITY_DN32019_c0_g2~~TRINITY_DN32019_c0_g2_i1.p1  ORF type:complete len:274 (+),score=57.63 TRINITY_DN32019_c0_g2_i1:48-824(+)
MSSKQFFDHCKHQDSYVYFSGKLSSVAASKSTLNDDVDLDAFMLSDPELNHHRYSVEGKKKKLTEDVHLWVGCAGVTASTHYDASHNLYLQVRGKKRFTIAPPSTAHLTCGIYPDSHPHRRQCQYPNRFGAFLAADPSDDDGHISQSVSYMVELTPGDLLYLPPYWLHKVETLETSISLSYWSEAAELEKFNEVLDLPVPFESHWSQEKLHEALKRYVHDLVGPQGAQEMLASRYAHVKRTNGFKRKNKESLTEGENL